MDTFYKIFVVLLLVGMNAFFVAAEFGIVSIRPTRLEQLVRSGDEGARRAQRLTADIDRFVAACQLGITLASLLLGWVGESTIAALLEPPVEHTLVLLLGEVGMAGSSAVVVSHFVAVVISLLLITAMHIVLGEQVPKVYSLRSPEQTTIWATRPLLLFNATFSPLIRFLDWITNLILRALGMREPTGHHAVPTIEDLKLLVEASGQSGILEVEEQEMIFNVFAFADRPASQVMVPRPQVTTIPLTANVRQFLDLYAETSYNRFPVTGESVDDIRGTISARDILLALREGRITLETPIEPLIRPAHFVPESKRVGPLMQELREQHLRMAVLIDEYGGMAGIVTVEDLVEEIVGELEEDLRHKNQQVEAVDERTVVVEAHVRIDEANEELGLHIPDGEYETLAGYILDRLGCLPEPGDSVQIDSATFTVVEMEGPRIERVQITRSV